MTGILLVSRRRKLTSGQTILTRVWKAALWRKQSSNFAPISDSNPPVIGDGQSTLCKVVYCHVKRSQKSNVRHSGAKFIPLKTPFRHPIPTIPKNPYRKIKPDFFADYFFNHKTTQNCNEDYYVDSYHIVVGHFADLDRLGEVTGLCTWPVDRRRSERFKRHFYPEPMLQRFRNRFLSRDNKKSLLFHHLRRTRDRKPCWAEITRKTLVGKAAAEFVRFQLCSARQWMRRTLPKAKSLCRSWCKL